METESKTPDLLQAIVDEAKRIEEDALYCHAGHNQAARGLNRWHYLLGIPTALLAAASSLSSFSSAGGFGQWTAILAGILSFFVAALTGLSTFLDPKGNAAAHSRAATSYSSLRNQARYLYSVDCKKGKPVDELDSALKSLRKQNEELDLDTPIISDAAMNIARAKIKAGEYTYSIDQK
jgi:hypothetical protein